MGKFASFFSADYLVVAGVAASAWRLQAKFLRPPQVQ